MCNLFGHLKLKSSCQEPFLNFYRCQMSRKTRNRFIEIILVSGKTWDIVLHIWLLWGRKKISQFEIWIFSRKMKIFQKNFGWESPPIISFFCAYPWVPKPLSFKDKTENVIFTVFKTVKKVIPDTNFWVFEKWVLWILFSFSIRVKTIDSYFLHYSKSILDAIWLI